MLKTKEPLGRTFNRLWSAAIASNFADGMLKTAAPLLAATLTQDPFLISMMAALVMLPWLFFAIPVGGLVDRVNRRLALAFANSARFLVAAALAFSVATGTITIWWLFIAAFLIGVAEVVYDTTTQAMIPQLVAKPNIDRANSRLQSAEVLVAEFVASPLSGVLYAVAIVIPFIVHSAGLITAAILVLLIPSSFTSQLAKPDSPDSGNGTSYWTAIREGISYLWADKKLMKLVTLTTAIGFAFAASQATMVLYLLKVQGVPVAAFGLILSAFGVGALIGSILAPRTSRIFGAGTTLAVINVLAGVFMTLLFWAPNAWVVAALFVLIGSTSGTWNVLLMSAYHRLIPNHLFGRIHGTRRTLVWGMMPIGSLIGGLMSSVDLRLPFLVGGVVATTLAVYYFRFLKELVD